MHFQDSSIGMEELYLIIGTLPVFGIGLAEDLCKRVSIRLRMILIGIGAFITVLVLNASINQLDIPGIDLLMTIPLVSIVFTIFAITGLTNAYNIIDGFHGLSSMIGIIALLGLGWIGFQLSDTLTTFLSLTMVAAILGFFIWNYPKGLIFLGDCGAYLIGFWVAVLSILLVNRHSEISPWFAVTINAYPIIETLFSMYRRKFHQNKNPGHPDGIHFHSLIYRRVLNNKKTSNKLEGFNVSAKTSPYLWVLNTFAVIPALLFWNSTFVLVASIAVFAAVYVWLYRRLVTFRVPIWLRI
jgi:UDP-N-acetylmuramyl pentapeptide phosphotransferase/UDP-N-acetylglucosamine-1-phosphate transferase